MGGGGVRCVLFVARFLLKLHHFRRCCCCFLCLITHSLPAVTVCAHVFSAAAPLCDSHTHTYTHTQNHAHSYPHERKTHPQASHKGGVDLWGRVGRRGWKILPIPFAPYFVPIFHSSSRDFFLLLGGGGLPLQGCR